MNTITLTEQPQADHNPALVYLAGLPAVTGQRTQAQALRVVAGILTGGDQDINRLDWGALRYQHTALVRSKLIEAYAPATANKILSALRGALKEAWRLGYMSAEDYQRARDLKPITGETLPAGRELSSGEEQALYDACYKDPTPAGIRDAAIIAILLSCGLRRAEIVGLNVSDLDPDNGVLVIRGKRSKERTAHLIKGTLSFLLDWLTLRGSEPGALFVEVDKGGNVLTERREITVKETRKVKGVIVPNKKAGTKIYRGGAITSQAIYNMLAKRALEADVKDFSPHDMRRTWIGNLLAAGADIATVSKMAGHKDVGTTARYDRRPEEAKREAANLLHVPYKKR